MCLRECFGKLFRYEQHTSTPEAKEFSRKVEITSEEFLRRHHEMTENLLKMFLSENGISNSKEAAKFVMAQSNETRTKTDYFYKGKLIWTAEQKNWKMVYTCHWRKANA